MKKKFRYLLCTDCQSDMNDLGEIGWELVSVVFIPDGEHLLFTFKKEIPAEHEG